MLARRVSAEGRTRAYLNGRSATAADLRDVGGALLSFYGQHEHRKLTLASSQLEILDGFCGPEQAARRAAFAAAYARERGLRDAARRAARARRGARPGARPARVGARRDRRGGAERGRGGRADRRARAAAPPRRAAAGRRGRDRGAARPSPATARRPRSAAPSRALEAMRGVDPALDALADRAAALAVEADDVAGELRRYGEAVDAPPGRLDEVEERLALFEKLKRKHGGTIAAVLAHAEACRAPPRRAGRRRGGAEGATAELGRGAGRSARARRGAARGARGGGRRAAGRGGRRARRPRDGGRELRGAR